MAYKDLTDPNAKKECAEQIAAAGAEMDAILNRNGVQRINYGAARANGQTDFITMPTPLKSAVAAVYPDLGTSNMDAAVNTLISQMVTTNKQFTSKADLSETLKPLDTGACAKPSTSPRR
jgi:hypothetical protein